MGVSKIMTGRVVALDLGEVRNGVALSDSTRSLATPLEIVSGSELDGFLRNLIENQGVTEVVVGVPKTLGGEVGFQARRVLDKINDLRDKFPGVTFVEWDERFTTRLVSTARKSGGRRGKKGKASGRVDHLAAAQMLQEYLEARGEI